MRGTDDRLTSLPETGQVARLAYTIIATSSAVYIMATLNHFESVNNAWCHFTNHGIPRIYYPQLAPFLFKCECQAVIVYLKVIGLICDLV